MDRLYIGGQSDDDGIFAFAFSRADGTLAPLGAAADAGAVPHHQSADSVGDGGLMTASADGRYIYATAADSAAAFAVGEDGMLTALGPPVATSIPCPASAALLEGPSGRGGALILPCYLGGGGVSVLERQADGSLGPERQLIGPFGEGSNADPARQEEAHPHSSWLSPLGQRVLLVPDLGQDKLLSFAVEPGQTCAWMSCPPHGTSSAPSISELCLA